MPPQSRLTRQSFQPRRGRRLSEWLSFTSVIETEVATATAILFGSISSAALSEIIPLTMIRVRGRLSVKSLVGHTVGAYGICVVQEAARAIGITAIPLPWSDASNDAWMYHQFVESLTPTTFNLNMEIDSKAMRKMEDGDALVFVFENAGLNSVDFNANQRILYLVS